MKFSAIIALAAISGAVGFAPIAPIQSPTALCMMTPQKGEENVLNGMKKAAAAFTAAAILASNVVTVDPVFAADDSIVDFGSTQVVAARSGGRAGGRSSAGRSMPRSSSSCLLYTSPEPTRPY